MFFIFLVISPNSFSIVLYVRYDILMFFFLSNFVANLFFPIYRVHLVLLYFSCDRVTVSLYPLLYAICLIILFSFCLSLCECGHLFNLLCRHSDAALVCSCGCHEVLCTFVLVTVGFITCNSYQSVHIKFG
jgi:hypothetical protein